MIFNNKIKKMFFLLLIEEKLYSTAMVFKSPCSGRAAIGAVLVVWPLSFKKKCAFVFFKYYLGIRMIRTTFPVSVFFV